MKKMQFDSPRMELLCAFLSDVITESWELPLVPGDDNSGNDWELPVVPSK